MWFFTLALLIVAGYLLYDAIRDRSAYKRPHELETTRQTHPTPRAKGTFQYLNTQDANAKRASEAASAPALDTPISSAESDHEVAAPRLSAKSSSKAIVRGSAKARSSVAELWNESKLKSARQKEAQQSQQDQNRPHTGERLKSGAVRTVENVGKVFSQAKQKYHVDVAARKSARVESRVVEVSSGVDKFKTGMTEVLQDSSARVREGVRKHAQGGGQALGMVGDQTIRVTSYTKESIGSGATRFTDSVAESLRAAKLKNETEKERLQDRSSRSSAQETLLDGTMRFRDSVSETWQQRKSASESGAVDNFDVTQSFSNIKDSVSTGVIRFKQSVGETLAESRSAKHRKDSGLTDASTVHSANTSLEANPGAQQEKSAGVGDESSASNALKRAGLTPRNNSESSASTSAAARDTNSNSSADSLSGSTNDVSKPAAKQADQQARAQQNRNTAAASSARTERQTNSAQSKAASANENKAATTPKDDAVAPLESSTPRVATPAFYAKPQGEKDDLTRVKGIGPVIEKSLNEVGVYHFHQLAAFKQEDIDYVNEELHFPGRIERDNWIAQAAELARNKKEKK